MLPTLTENDRLRQELLALRERFNDELQLILNRYCPPEHRAPPRRDVMVPVNGTLRNLRKEGKHGHNNRSRSKP